MLTCENMFQAMTFRPAKPEDDGFLFSQYLQRRVGEIAELGWTDNEVHSFLKMQFDMRRRAYNDRYPQAHYRVIQLGEVAVGQMIVYCTASLIILVDIDISIEFRGRGIGSEAIRRLQGEARAAGVPLILHVDRINVGAQRLYRSLGFEVADDKDQVSIEMKWCQTQSG